MSVLQGGCPQMQTLRQQRGRSRACLLNHGTTLAAVSFATCAEEARAGNNMPCNKRDCTFLSYHDKVSRSTSHCQCVCIIWSVGVIQHESNMATSAVCSH